MELKIEKIDWLFLLLCLFVGIIAEEAFFRNQIGVSYFVFIAIFYMLFFWRFRTFSFTHQRLGYLVLISIWLLAAGYYLYDTTLFYTLNILVIPALVIFHLALITSPKKIEWNNLFFIVYTILRLVDGIRYSAIFTIHFARLLKRSSNEKHYNVWKKILIGMAISVPFLFVVLNLLISADTQFERLLGSLPELLSFRADNIFRLVIVLIYTFGFFGFMQVLLQKNIHFYKREGTLKPIAMDGIITLTVLLLLDLVYVLFVAVQFRYFFSGTLDNGFTYAEYARRGFFELLFVSLINLTVTTVVIHFTKSVQGFLQKTIRLALTVLVLSSGILLVSAFMRMTMYEDAYGFTFTRVLVHSFMIFLMVIFAYTLVKIWLQKLSLFHFYFIASLIYYAGINIVNIDKIVVDQNIARFELTGNIDIHYLNHLSSTGILGLIDLYENKPDVAGLHELLKQRKAERENLKSDSWQSHNLERKKAYEKLGELNL
ncbi:DUF4173 domain-containing protein [Bacillus sp. FJAT-29790]|uniref:DUF4153 domain-containing protein n=1 Tax=Bacillus sp. FJAT-29790 TaxID=1895002 RepID=UPI001C234BD9|nr:DUF4173 domain-containing protein [Bacillus sp. FJAT-29790]MBU8880563.1 DUF4173 domain-containing protein [Bacillus sp. FJAT-29790]